MNHFILNRLIQTLNDPKFRYRGGQWIDAYNQITNPDVTGTILTTIDSSNNFWVMVIYSLHPGQSGAIHNTEDVAPTICASEGVKTQTKIMEEQMVLGWTRDEKGNVVDRHPVEVANAVTASKRDNTQNYVVHPNYRIRKLTPRECFRLMGVADPDIDKLIEAGISNSQLYKLAGNSIVVHCLAGIFRQLFVANENKNQQLEIF